MNPLKYNIILFAGSLALLSGGVALTGIHNHHKSSVKSEGADKNGIKGIAYLTDATPDKIAIPVMLPEVRITEFRKKMSTRQFAETAPVHDRTRGIVFRVQILASPYRLPIENRTYKGMPIEEFYNKGEYKYTIGEFRSPAESDPLFVFLADHNLTDAFIVAFKNDNPITVKDAMVQAGITSNTSNSLITNNPKL